MSRALPDVNCTVRSMRSVRLQPEVEIPDSGTETPESAWRVCWPAWIWIPCALESAGMPPGVGNLPQKSDSLYRELKQEPFFAEIDSAQRPSVEDQFEVIGVRQ